MLFPQTVGLIQVLYERIRGFISWLLRATGSGWSLRKEIQIVSASSKCSYNVMAIFEQMQDAGSGAAGAP